MTDIDQILKPSNTNKISVSGLRMLISKQLITDHGGSIKLLSSVKGDTRIEIQLSCELNG
jgi:signal transduction histidine kinase